MCSGWAASECGRIVPSVASLGDTVRFYQDYLHLSTPAAVNRIEDHLARMPPRDPQISLSGSYLKLCDGVDNITVLTSCVPAKDSSQEMHDVDWRKRRVAATNTVLRYGHLGQGLSKHHGTTDSHLVNWLAITLLDRLETEKNNDQLPKAQELLTGEAETKATLP